MQLKFTRSTSEKGMMTKTTVYHLRAILMATEEESELLSHFGRMSKDVWMYGNERDFSEQYEALMRTSFQNLESGVEYKDTNFNNIRRIEITIVEACKSVLETCYELATFDGSDRVVQITGNKASIVASD